MKTIDEYLTWMEALPELPELIQQKAESLGSRFIKKRWSPGRKQAHSIHVKTRRLVFGSL